MRSALLALCATALVFLALWSQRAGRSVEGGGKALPTRSSSSGMRGSGERRTQLVTPPRRRPLPDATTEPSAKDAEPAAEVAGRKDVATRAPRPPSAVLYRHATHDDLFPGERWVIAEGLWDAGPAFGDDQASAADVPDGVILTLYDEPGGGGARVTLGPGRHNLAPLSFNDVASSARVVRADMPHADAPVSSSPSVQLFENLPREGPGVGRVWTLPLAEARTTKLFAARDGFFENDAPLAIWIPAGMEATLFDEPDGRGFAFVLGPGLHELERSRFAGRVSSVRVRRAR